MIEKVNSRKINSILNAKKFGSSPSLIDPIQFEVAVTNWHCGHNLLNVKQMFTKRKSIDSIDM